MEMPGMPLLVSIITFTLIALTGAVTSYSQDSGGEIDILASTESLYENETETEKHYGVHLASLNFAYVRKPLVITIFLLIVALCKLGFHHANFLSSKVPESCLLIVLGTAVSAIIHYTGIQHEQVIEFTAELFFLYLLPPIILESAYSLHDRVFFENLGTILLYAVVGTVLNCFILAPSLYGLAVCGAMGPISVTLVQCFVFGALIVAVDPVAVLAIFQEIGVNSVLYFLVFGESLLNDAVTVVIYNTMKAFSQMETIPIEQIFLAIGAFFTVSLGGLCIGLVIGGLTAFITKYTRSVRVVEPLAIFSLAYASYLMAECFHFSGIISIIGCGLMQAQYAFHNISHKSHTTVVYFSKMLSTTSDSIIFMFLGFSLIGENLVWHTGFVLWSIFLCLVVRFMIVYFLTFLANRFMRLRTVNYEEQFIMAYGGLRGAVAFSLVAMLKEIDLPNQPMFETATLAVIIFTVFVQGISIKPLVKCLRITSSAKNPVSIYEEINEHVTDHVLAGIEEICGHYGHNRVREMMDYFDNQYLRPLLMRNPKTKDDNIMELYEKMALQMHFENISGATMWTEYTSDYELYKPEIIMSDEMQDDPNLGYMTLDTQGGSSAYPPVSSPYFRRDIYRRQRTLSEESNKPTDNEKVTRLDSSRSDIDTSLDQSMEVPTKDPEEQRVSVKSRSRSLVNRLKRTFSSSEDEDDTTIEEPTIDDLRRWLVKNPTTEIFLRKSDRNLTNEDNIDFLHHLREKQMRVRRLSMALRSPSRSATQSPVGSPYGSTENIAGRHVLNVITEGVPMEGEQRPMSPRRLSAAPYQRQSGILRPKRLLHSATIDADGRRHTYPQRAKQPRKRSLKPQNSSQAETRLQGSEQSNQSKPSVQRQQGSGEDGRQVQKPTQDGATNGTVSNRDRTSQATSPDAVTVGITPAVRPPMISTPSERSLKGRGHLVRQKTQEEPDAPEDDAESVV